MIPTKSQRVSVRNHCSLIQVSLIIGVIQEWHDDLVPAWEASVGSHSDKVGEPGDVLDLLLLQLHVGIESSIVELLLEGHRESADLLFKHNFVYIG
jgi:hypothetical protein